MAATVTRWHVDRCGDQVTSRNALAAINDELNALDWDPPLRRVVIPRRNRFDVKFFFPDGASARWVSNPKRSLTPIEMIEQLEKIISTIRRSQRRRKDR